jgi:hypothetical protein
MAPCPHRVPGGTVDRPGEQTPSSIRLGERRVRTAGQSIDRPGTTGSRVQALNKRSIAPPATSNMTDGQGPHRPESRQGKNEEPHAHAYIPFVRGRTICLDSPDAPALDGHEALLPDKRLHELPRAAPGTRHRHLPGLRLYPPHRLTPADEPGARARSRRAPSRNLARAPSRAAGSAALPDHPARAHHVGICRDLSPARGRFVGFRP